MTGREAPGHTCQGGWQREGGAVGRWPTSSWNLPEPWPRGRGVSLLLSKLPAASASTPLPALSKVPQKDSETRIGQAPARFTGLSYIQPWAHTETEAHGEQGTLAMETDTRSTLAPSFPASATWFQPLGWMDHSAFPADLGDQTRVWQWKGPLPRDGVRLGLPLPWIQNFHEMMFIVFKSSSLEWDGRDCYKSVHWLKPLICKL